MQNLAGILSQREMYSVDETQTVAEVVRHMTSLHVGAILILGGGVLRGIFSERDLMTRVVLEHLDAATTRVGQVMTTGLATIDEKATIDQAMETMGRIGCRHLPVLRAGNVVGMVSMRDLMGVELARKTEEIEHMRAYIHGSS